MAVKKFRTYIVTIHTDFGRDAEEEFHAESRAGAIKQARKMMWDNGHTRHDGPVTYAARVKQDD